MFAKRCPSNNHNLGQNFMKNKLMLLGCAFFTSMLSVEILADTHRQNGNTKEWEIQTYTSAAPSFIGEEATVIGASGEILRTGTNGWRCEPFMLMPEGGFETPRHAIPACSDANAVAWAEAYKTNKTPKLEADGWIWMLHGDLGTDNFKPHTDGQKDAGHRHYIESGPHLMLMPQDPASLEGQTTDFTTGAPYVMFEGSPYVHLMIPLEGYYQYQPASAPK